MKKKIFIAGGSGYVGCHLAKKLVNMGHFVRVLDLQLYGKNLEESENLELIKGDIRNTSLVDETLKGVDTVILGCTHYPLLKIPYHFSMPLLLLSMMHKLLVYFEVHSLEVHINPYPLGHQGEFCSEYHLDQPLT